MLKESVDALARVVLDARQRLLAACIALSLTLCGVTRAFFEMSSGGVGSFPMPGDNILMVVLCALVGFAGCRFHKALGGFFRSMAGRVAVSLFALVSVGAVCVCRFVDAQMGADIFFYAGVAARIAGLLCLMSVYVRVSPLDVGACAAQVVVGMVVSILLDLLFMLFAPAGVAVAGLVIPVLFLVCLTFLDKLEQGDSGENPDAQPASPYEAGHLPWLRLVTFGIYGVVAGLASSQAHSLGVESSEAPSLVSTCLMNDAGLLVGVAALLIGTALLSARRVEAFALRYLLVPAYLVAIFLSPLLSGMVGTVIPILMAFSQALFYGLLWVFPRPAPSGEHLRWFSACCGFFFVGTYIGMFVGGDFLPQFAAGDVYMVIAALAIAVLLMLEFAPRFTDTHPDAVKTAPEPGAWVYAPVVGESPAADAQETYVAVPESVAAVAASGDPALGAAAGIDALAARAAKAWGLTPRETAVLPGLLRGRSVAWVAESLTVSKNTVHTHMRNIYAKAGVHSQEELIDAAEAL